MKKYTILIVLLISMISSIIIFSQSLPHTINYQGVLKDASGVVLANGEYNITFKLYNISSGGAVLWAETKSINVIDGIISTQLGSVTPVNLPFDVKYWLGVTIGAGTELTPRLELSTVPYSYMSMNVPNGTLIAEKIASGQVVKSINSIKDNVNLVAGSNVTITPNGNNITISSNGSSSFTLPFEGEIATPNTKGINILHSATTGTNNGLYTVINSTLGSAVVGIVNSTTGATRGIFGENHSSTGTGVYGANTSTSGVNYGVYGVTHSSTGTGVYGYANDNSGPENYGVHGRSESPVGQGVRGISPYIGIYGRAEGTTDLNYGIFGRSLSPDGHGIHGTAPRIGAFGISSNTTGEAFGVWGETKSTSGYGVYGLSPYIGVKGYSSQYGGVGVYGENSSTGGNGVWGESPWYGVVGITRESVNPTDFRAGIYGESRGTGTSYAARFEGKVYVTGFIQKLGGGFQIDHPLDPENKYLNHSFVESPDMKNIYDGVVTLNAEGKAVVQLADWFEALNQDFRYQLTAIGEPGPNLFIESEINNNQFTIAGGSPGLKVSWQVTGIRHDAYAENNRMLVEENKKGAEVGKYLTPESFGLPDEKGIKELYRPKLIMNKEE